MSNERLPAVGQLTSDEARALTDEVRDDAAALWAKLLMLYEGGAHIVLGYTSWGAYFEAEFGQDRSRGYQLLTAARVVAELPQSTIVDSRPNEAQARELAKAPAGARTEIWEQVTANGPPTAADVKEAVQSFETAADLPAWAPVGEPEDSTATPAPAPGRTPRPPASDRQLPDPAIKEQTRYDRERAAKAADVIAVLAKVPSLFAADYFTIALRQKGRRERLSQQLPALIAWLLQVQAELEQRLQNHTPAAAPVEEPEDAEAGATTGG